MFVNRQRPLSNTDLGAGTGGGGAAPPAPEATPAPTPELVPSDPFISSIPEQYREAPWVQNILRSEDRQKATWEQFANLQELLGKRPGSMPADDASDEQWERWNNAVAPKDITVYGDIKPKLSEEQAHLKDIIESGYPDSLVTDILETARQNGVPKRAMNAIVSKLNTFNVNMAEQLYAKANEEAAALDKDFDEVFAKSFGKDSNKYIEAGNAFLREHTPDEMKPFLTNLPNNALALIANLAYSAQQKYGREDRVSTGGTSHAPIIEDRAYLNSEISKAMAHEAYANQMHPQHERQQAVVKALCAKLANITDFKVSGK